MLVSAIASFNAITAQNRAGFALMKNNENTMSMIRASRGTETNFNALHQQDTRNAVDTAKNQFSYKVASAWKKHCEAQMKKEVSSNKLNYQA